jgi:two-component system, chemotaxis family, CheB/CheR fusion protein
VVICNLSTSGKGRINEENPMSNEALKTPWGERQVTQEELIRAHRELLANFEQLIAEKEYVEAIVESLREPLLVLRADMHVQWANSGYYHFFVVTPHETLGRSIYDLGNGQWNIHHLPTLLQGVLVTGQPFQNFEAEYDFPTIGHKVLLLNGSRILHQQERIKDHLILLTMYDITSRRELERQKDALPGIVSHELKAPLTSAKLYIYLLRRNVVKREEEQAAIHLEKLEKQISLLSFFVNDLVDTTAIEKGMLRMNLAPFAINDLVQSVVEKFRLTYPALSLFLEKEADTEVYGDQMRTGQVLVNLLSNAVKYSQPDGHIHVKVKVDEDLVTVSVRDHGVGIPRDQQERIFERFYHAREAQQERVTGLGLGLFIARQIVKQQGGRIWVESTPGEGATFFFTIPCRPATGIHGERQETS